VACPLLVIHGEHDAICPPEDGRLIAHAAPEGSFACVFGGDHNRLWTDPEMLEQTRDAAGAFFVLLAN
jgi:pimeloyl-[acyl-carrier protein] methyl ester esterase